MAQTLDKQAEEKERKAAIEQLRTKRSELANKLSALDDSIEQMENNDFKARLGNVQLSKMTIKQKSEVVDRLGLDAFLGLLKR